MTKTLADLTDADLPDGYTFRMARELVLPWPDRALHPNSRGHWSKRAKAAKAARRDAAIIAKAAGWHRRGWPEGRLHFWVTFYPPDKRRRDDDGLIAALKPWRDGIADAMGVDDVRFVTHAFVHTDTRPGGQVVVRISGGP